MSKEFGGVPEVAPEGATAAGGRGRAGAVLAWDAALGWEEVNRVKSSRMFRAASQPDKSNNPMGTVCLTRLLIVIPAYPKHLS